MAEAAAEAEVGVVLDNRVVPSDNISMGISCVVIGTVVSFGNVTATSKPFFTAGSKY